MPQFMKHVYDAVEKADQVYIIGPGEMKKNFNHFIIQEHKRLSPKILGLENCDYLKESQIVDKVKKFFNHK
jgi:stalled ribosome rescue protein Dom34